MLEEGNTLIQVVVGPRQTGKSTMIAQALRGLDVLAHSVSADDILAPTEEWLRDERQQVRNLQRMSHSPVILVLDEVQKVKGWPNIVKGLWDADRRDFLPLKVFLSGSSSLLLRKGLEDSPKGRFELIRSPPLELPRVRRGFRVHLGRLSVFRRLPGGGAIFRRRASLDELRA